MASEQSTLFLEEVDNFLQFAGAEKARPNAVFIAVMGLTGSGKSAFVNAVTGRNHVKIGHELASCTSSVGIFHCEIDKYNVYFIDTPGFNDTNLSDLTILKTVSNFLSVSYVNKNYFAGVIYMHAISDTRMSGSKRHNLDMFKALCGEDVFSNVAVLTSMWMADEQETSVEFGNQVARETQLRSEFLRDILDQGGLLRRLKSSRSSSSSGGGGGNGSPSVSYGIDAASAKAVFKELLKAWHKDEITLRIQEELVNEGLPLSKTAAGQVLMAHLDNSFEQSAPPPYNPFWERTGETDRADRDALNVNVLQIYDEEQRRSIAQIVAMEDSWRQELVMAEERHAAALKERDAHPEQPKQPRQPQTLWDRMDKTEAEAQALKLKLAAMDEKVEQTKRELEKARAETEAKLKSTVRVRDAWPAVASFMSGAMSLAGATITAGFLCIIQ